MNTGKHRRTQRKTDQNGHKLTEAYTTRRKKVGERNETPQNKTTQRNHRVTHHEMKLQRQEGRQRLYTDTQMTRNKQSEEGQGTGE